MRVGMLVPGASKWLTLYLCQLGGLRPPDPSIPVTPRINSYEHMEFPNSGGAGNGSSGGAEPPQLEEV